MESMTPPTGALAPMSRFGRFVVVASVAFRLLLLGRGVQVGEASFLQPDSATYLAPAEAIIACGRFSISAAECGVAEVLRTPGYPLLIAACRVFFGAGVLPLLAVQVALSALVLVITYRFAERMGGLRAANAAIGLSALQVNAVHYSVQVLTETPFTVLLAASMWQMARALDEDSHRSARSAWAGILLAGATFVRPASFFLAWPLAAVFAVLLVRRRVAHRLSIGAALVFAACAMLPLHAWQLRNSRASGFGGFSSISAASLLLYRAAGVEAIERGIPFEEAQAIVRARVAPYDPRNPGESVREFRAEARKVLSSHPAAVLRMTATGAARMLLGSSVAGSIDQFRFPSVGSPARDALGTSPADFARKWLIGNPVQLFIRGGAMTVLLVLYPLAAIGALRCPWGRRAHGAIAGFVLLYLVAVSAGPEAYARFRVPAVPPLCILAGLGWSLLPRFSLRFPQLRPAER